MSNKPLHQKSRRNRWTVFDFIVNAVALLAVVVCLYPVIYVLACSFSDPGAVAAGQVKLWPVGFSTMSYKLVVEDSVFWRSFANSIGYVFASCAFMLFNSIMLAYPLTRSNFRGKKFLTYFLLITMYFSGGMIPSFLVIHKLGLYNTPWALVLPGYSAFNVILCRTYMKSLPEELVDAAFIDGANQIQTLLKIVVPLSKPVLAVLMIYTIVGTWNSWLGATIYTTNQDIQPIQLYLTRVMNQSNLLAENSSFLMSMPKEVLAELEKTAMSMKQLRYSAIVLVSFPILVVYPMFQKYFIKGVMLGSLKG